MKRIGLATAFCGLVVAIGCGNSGDSSGDGQTSTNGDDDDAGATTNRDAGEAADSATPAVTMVPIHVTWSLKKFDGTAGACQSGYTTIFVTATPYQDGGTTLNGFDTTKGFDCSAGSGDIMVQRGGQVDMEDIGDKYRLRIQETNSDGSTAWASDLATAMTGGVDVPITAAGGAISTSFLTDGGYAWNEWGLFGTMAMDYQGSCSAAGVDHIKLTFTEQTTMAKTSVTYPCQDYGDTLGKGLGLMVDIMDGLGGAITPLPAGDYQTLLEAVANGTTVGSATDDLDILIKGRNDIDFVGANADYPDLTTR